MSLACRECRIVGAFDTYVIRLPDTGLDMKKSVSHHTNFCICRACATVGNFQEDPNGQFAIVVEDNKSDAWNTGTDGPPLSAASVVKRISRAELERQLPETAGCFG